MYKEAFDKHADLFAELGVNPNLGMGSVYEKVRELGFSRQRGRGDLRACHEHQPGMAMVDSDKGIPTCMCRAT